MSKSKGAQLCKKLFNRNEFKYCKHGHFRWGKISRKCWQDLSRGVNFHNVSSISLIKSYGFYFPVGEIFVKKTISRKMPKLPPCQNFHVYSPVNGFNFVGTNFRGLN